MTMTLKVLPSNHGLQESPTSLANIEEMLSLDSLSDVDVMGDRLVGNASPSPREKKEAGPSLFPTDADYPQRDDPKVPKDPSDGPDGTSPKDNQENDDKDKIKETKRALCILKEAVELLDSINKGVVLSQLATSLKTTAEITGVQPSIVMYAQKHGIFKAHNMFFKDKLE